MSDAATYGCRPSHDHDTGRTRMANEVLLDAAKACLSTLRGRLDQSRLTDADETNIHAPHAIALVGRMVFLCEGACDLLAGDRALAAPVLLRPAIECWVDACYVLYCRGEAVLHLTSLSLEHRRRLAR